MSIKELENLPDGIIHLNTKSIQQIAEELYAQMYKVTLDREDAKDCAIILAKRLKRETQDSAWSIIEQNIKNL